MNLFSDFLASIRTAANAVAADYALQGTIDLDKVTAEPPREPTHGDIATNAAMVLTKAFGKPPRVLAEAIAAKLSEHTDVAHVDIAGPGFINIRLRQTVWPRLLDAALSLGESYGGSRLGGGLKANVEYVSANPTGPLHVGHCRGAVFGDALAQLLTETGFDVTREYYINDAGAQVDTVARSAFLRYREALGETIGEIPSGLYPGDYLKPVGAVLAREHGDGLLALDEAQWLPIVRTKAMAMMMDLIRDDLAALNIRQEVFFSEKSLHDSGEVADTIADLRAAGHVYQGSLPPPKGEVPDDWEDREQTLFRATAFGDDMDRPLLKSDGSFTYFASDVAYSRNKIRRGYKELIYILGADHGGYVKRLEAVAAAVAGPGAVKVVVRLCQLVKLYRAGEPVRMSKRAGEFVTLRDVVDEVGPDVVRFMMLFRKNEAPLDFDFAKVTEQSKDNPVFYVQYAHARTCSVLRNAEAEGLSGGKPDFALLTDPAEMGIIRRIAEYPRLLESAAIAHEPHRVAFYLYELAGEFHALWNKGKESPQLRFILKEDLETTITRLAFLRVIRYVLANGLRILGVRPADEM
ncbi:MAG: arginine--tRNA ligase [Alphaproteobacteria bacterium]|jgi:arginyl-tRNA synthetase|nr:arginine--tRNA ligase [Alphaproteobacteria bacterium]